MRYLKKFKLFESINTKDIEDIFLELKDEGFTFAKEEFDIDSEYGFTHEFLCYKKGDTDYSIDYNTIELFNIEEVIDVALRFKAICLDLGHKFRILTHDGEFTLDITNKLDNLNSIDKSDVLASTHLNLKGDKKGDIDLKNIKFISFQIMK